MISKNVVKLRLCQIILKVRTDRIGANILITVISALTFAVEVEVPDAVLIV